MQALRPGNVLKLISSSLNVSNEPLQPPNSKEIELCDIIKEIITRSINDTSFEAEDVYTLEFLQPFKPQSAHFVDEIEAFSPEELQEELEEEEEGCVEGEWGEIDLDYKRRAVAYWRSGKSKLLSVGCVRSKFRKVKSINQLFRWKNSLEKGGTQREKLLQVSTYVFNKFLEITDSHGIIHDMNLKKWALQISREIGLDNFKASSKWITNFKMRHNIVSRKITKFVSRSYGTDSAQLEEIASTFVNNIKPKIEIFFPENIYNADESGFNLEVHSSRTLSLRGSKEVPATVQSVFATTHSYSILPGISAIGKLLPTLLIVLKEPGGQFGPRVQQNLLQLPNIKAVASSSGKLTSEIFKNWFIDIYLPYSGNRSILLLDSWTGHCPNALQEEIPPNKEVQIFTIPKKTTGLIQPLDVYGFRLWKGFAKAFSDLVVLGNYEITISERNNIVKLQALIHNQFSAPLYLNIFKYAWFKAGYLGEKPIRGIHPLDYIFLREEAPTNRKCKICEANAEFRCSWCTEIFCFKHFYEELHYHEIAESG